MPDNSMANEPAEQAVGHSQDDGAPATPRHQREWPSVSVVMPVRNEEHHLETAVMSILAQQYPGELDICMAIGPSEDSTASIADRLSSDHDGVHTVNNPDGTIPAGLNRAIAATSGQVVVRVDGHSELPAGYISQAVATLMDTGAANVGGRQLPVGTTPFERNVAAAMTSMIGSGGATFHVGGEPGPTDTVFLGVFARQAGDAVGWFDEELLRNEDYELNYRLRKVGGTVWFDPELVVTYQPRSSWSRLADQYFHYGYWKAVVLRRHPESLKARQAGPPLIPLLAAIGLTLAVARTPIRPLARLGLGAVLVALVASPVVRVVAVMQLAWSAGFWRSVLDQITGKRPT